MDFYSVPTVAKPTWPAFHFLSLDGILQTATNTFSELPTRVVKLSYAIEWMLMPTTYSEVRLIARMTALENLAYHNLDDNESKYVKRASFDRLAERIREIIREENLPPSERDAMTAQVGSLNRKSLDAKIKKLLERWNVPVEDLP